VTVSIGTSLAEHEADPVPRRWPRVRALPRTLLLRFRQSWVLAISALVTIFGTGHANAAEVRFFDTGHFALETHAREIAAAIGEFLGQLNSNR